jgi:hypothetical protein
MKTFVGCYKLLPKFAILMVVLSRIAPIIPPFKARPTTDQQPTNSNNRQPTTKQED